MRQDTPAYSLTVHRCSGTAERRAKRSDSVGEAPSPWPQIKRPFKLRHSMTPRRQQGLTFALVCQILPAHIADTPREVPGVAFLTVPAHTHTSANPLDLACKQGACLGMWTPDAAVMMVPAHGHGPVHPLNGVCGRLLEGRSSPGMSPRSLARTRGPCMPQPAQQPAQQTPHGPQIVLANSYLHTSSSRVLLADAQLFQYMLSLRCFTGGCGMTSCAPC